MKATTKLQIQIVALNEKLPKITKVQEKWAFKNCLDHKATRLKSGKTTCLDCGEVWENKHQQWHNTILRDTCPSCNEKVQINDTKKKNFDEWCYMTVIDSFKGFQVIRLCKVSGYYKAGTKANLSCWEVSRIWIAPNGKYEIIGFSHIHTYYQDSWCGEFALKNRNSIKSHNLKPYLYYPKMKITNEVKRNGFKRKFYSLTPFELFTLLLSNSKAETILKSNQIELFNYMGGYNGFNIIEKHWSSIKICMKNNYIISNCSDYFDYLDLLKEFGKDLTSVKYVCPVDLEKEHDKYVQKKRKTRAKQKLEELKEEIKNLQKRYKKEKKPFFNVMFQKEEIKILFMNNVKDFLKDGEIFKHCIFENEYFKKKDSLMFCAYVNGKKTETVEVSISKLQVLQARGNENKHSIYHNQIIDLMNENIPQIKKLTKENKTLKTKKKQLLVA